MNKLNKKQTLGSYNIGSLMQLKEMIIAIDGAAASGKGTLSEFLAKHYKCEWLPTGNLYRVIAKYLINKHVTG